MQNNIRHENKVFDVLFDAIEKQEEYNEKDLLKKFADKPFVKQFALTKSRLYDQVLRSLDALYADSSVDAELKQNLHFVEILFRKTLYRQAEKLLYLTRKKAMKHEKISSLIEISYWEKRLLEKSGYAGDSTEGIRLVEETDKWLIDQLKTADQLWTLKSRLFSKVNKAGYAEQESEMATEMKMLEEQFDEQRMTIDNRYLRHHTLSAWYFGIHDYENCYRHLQCNAELIEKNAFLFKDEPNVYFSVLSNLIFICSNTARKQEALQALDRLRNVQSLFEMENNDDLLLKHFNMLASAELALYKESGNYEEALSFADQIEQALDKFSDKMNPTRRAFYYFNLSSIYLANAKFSLALKWCNELMNEKSIEEQEKSRLYGAVLLLLIHFDLEHQDYLPVVEKQLGRLSNTNPETENFIRLFIRFAGQIQSTDSAQKRKTALEKLGTELMEMKNRGEEEQAFEYFDFIRWANSRHSGIPFTMLQQ